MKHGTQKKIAEEVGISAPYLNEILNCKKRPTWNMAKRLGEVTGTDPILWADGRIDEIKGFLEREEVTIETAR